MMDSPYRERRYGSDEVQEIVTEALDGRAMSRDELGRVLDALGVEPNARIRLLSSGPTGSRRVPNAVQRKSPDLLPAPIRLERTVDGELGGARTEDVAELVRDAFPGDGQLVAVGRKVTWTSRRGDFTAAARSSVKVQSRDGRTRIRIEHDLKDARIGAGLGYALALGVWSIGVSIAYHRPLKALVFIAVAMGIGWITRVLARRYFDRKSNELEQLFASVAAEIEGVRVRPRIATLDGSAAARDERVDVELETEDDVVDGQPTPALARAGS